MSDTTPNSQPYRSKGRDKHHLAVGGYGVWCYHDGPDGLPEGPTSVYFDGFSGKPMERLLTHLLRAAAPVREEDFTASKRLAAIGNSHTNYAGCFDGFPERWQVGDIPDDVDCAACQAIKAWYRTLDRADAHRMGPPRWEPGLAQDEWANRCLVDSELWPCAATARAAR